MMVRRGVMGAFPSAMVMVVCVYLLGILAGGAAADDKSSKIDPDAAANYTTLAKSISPDRLSSAIRFLSGIQYPIPSDPGEPALTANSRLAGTPGADQARDYIKGQLSSILGAGAVTQEDFSVTVPVDHGASIATADGKQYVLQPLWPNLVRTSTLPEAGITGPLIYGGRGDLRSFRGKNVSGSIVLMDFNCGTRWMNAPRMGARAVIFVEPTSTMRGEAEEKFLGIPVNIPRFWISHEDATTLEGAALTTPQVTVTVRANQPWEARTASNIIGVLPGSDPVLGKQIMIVESYYDSMSIVPTSAPGAESASGVAAMLELARAFKADPPKRTVWFVASGAHFLGIQGAREYVDRHLDEWEPASTGDQFLHWISFGHVPLPTDRKQVMLFSGLDLSTQSPSIGAFYKGYFYNSREDIASNYADLGRTLRDNAGKIGQVLGFDADNRYGDGINAVNGKTWSNYLPGDFGFDAEAAMMAGGNGITFCSTDDARELSDTPEDTWDHVNTANLLNQTRLLACEYWDLFNDTNDAAQVPADSAKGIMPIPTWPAWTREGLQLGFCSLDGRDLLFDPKRNFVPDVPVQNSLAVLANPDKTMVGVRGNLIQLTDSVYPDPEHKLARFKFVGLPLVIAQDPSIGAPGLRFPPAWNMHLAAYHLKGNTPGDPDDSPVNRGDIDYAPDQGVDGAETYPTEFTLSGEAKTTEVIEFPCVATSIYDLIDQQALKSLIGIRIFDGATDSDPRQYGYVLGGRDVAVLFSSSLEKTRLKVVMDSGPGIIRMLLINSKPPDPHLSNVENEKRAEGSGYLVNGDDNGPDSPVQNGAITKTAWRVAQDMWNLDEFRLKMLAKYRIVNDELTNDKGTGTHDIAKSYLDQANVALANHDYDLFDTDSRKAWAYEARVYPQAQSTANDVVQGVIFYLFLLIPFAFFLERLLIASRDLNRQLGWTFGIFMVVFGIFTQIHPAFDITINPIIVLIAFVMLALSVFVSAIVWGKFEEQIKSLRRTVSGVHKTDVGKASVAFAAFTLGISNMRRRKERTLLTCITLVLLTFTVLSFTSVVSGIRFNDVPADGTAIYNGILLHYPDWGPLQEPAYRFLSDEYGHQYPVAPRVWYTGAPQGQTSYLTVRRAQASLNLKGVVGLSPQEAQVTHADSTLIAGRWFNVSDTYSAILPKTIADQLGITAADVGKATVDFSGVPYMVIGILDPDKLMGIKDLDSEELTPVDFTSAQNQNSASQAKSSYQQFTHVDAATIMFVPYNTLYDLGGDYRSVAIDFGTKAITNDELHKLMPRLDMNLYAGMDGKIHRFSAIQSTNPGGDASITIMIVLASLIVLNTMLGSVYERIKEIKTFSSVGLSPGNIAMLFFAEALVYAVIGAVAGYLVGQTLAKIISVYHILPGLTLNFSSTSAEISIGVVIAVVLLSTIFPARKASQVATPSLDSTWKVPEPDGDTWTIMLPFAVTGSQVRGINAFLTEWFKSYEEQSVGDFLTQGVTASTFETDLGAAYSLSGRVWLAPFDLGVSEDFTLNTKPTELEGVFEVELVIVRVSGDVSNWKRINRRFLNVTRKQFLIWRTLTAEERERYLDEAGTPAGDPSDTAVGAGAVAPAM